jgi:hypothetical protein
MGIDVEIYIRAAPTPELLKKVRAPAKEQLPDSSLRYPVIDSVSDCGDHINISSCSRYFSRGYPRGSWPDIKAALLALRDAVPPGTVIEYGGDYSEWAIPADDVLIADLDQAWADLTADG